MSGKKGYIVRNQRNKNQLLFLTFILRTFDKNFAQLHYCSDIFCYEENASDQYEDGTHPGICGRGILCSIYVSGLHPFHAGRYGGISADRRGKAVADVLEGGFSAFEACQRDTYHISDHVDLE